MRTLLLAALCCYAAHAAVIRGVVLDRSTGRPLARALVALRPVEGSGGAARSGRANRGGQFAFTVPAGMYLVRAEREGFAPFQYGQRDSKSAGKPVFVEDNGSLYLDIRLRRYAAISGTVLDENEIGIPGQKVIAYPAARPLRVAATAITDDRGIYRIHGLEPGSYYVRAAAKELEDRSGLLPTFHKETALVDESMTVDVDLDQQADDIDIRPLPGKLFHVIGKVLTYPPVPVTVRLISDAGRMETKTAETFVFEHLAPGNYELIAEADGPRGRGKLAASQELFLENDKELQVALNPWPETEFRMHDEKGNPIDPATAKITARRKDLDGGGRPEVLKLENGHAALGPGRWEFAVLPPPGFYSVPDGWTEIQLHGYDAITLKLSSHPASLHGVVNGPGHEPVPGAPVYLEAFDQGTGKRLADLRIARTNARGEYHFNGLAPGLYRILATFEYELPESAAMEAARARSLTLSQATDTNEDLDLYAP